MYFAKLVYCLFIECPAGKYKPKINNKKCKNCPSNSYSPEKGATVCKCKFGHFRPPKNNSEDPCYRKLRYFFMVNLFARQCYKVINIIIFSFPFFFFINQVQ